MRVSFCACKCCCRHMLLNYMDKVTKVRSDLPIRLTRVVRPQIYLKLFAKHRPARRVVDPH